ncbi:DUF222 domain-containing protein [Paraconexibacter sp. AEG42_29]|uniref:HNH endonuclease signature motif containing protein n=1 Tax=Paraconexibacter sp. AEG42_29 TaxID=2997339 RepID=UPI00339D69D1
MLIEAGKERTSEELGDEIAAFAAHMSAAMCRWLALVAEFDVREAWGELGFISCAHWVSWRCGVAPVTAREYVRIAARLREMPLTEAAFARGELSYSKVRALARVDGVVQEAELVAMAREASAAQLERIVASFRGVTRADADRSYSLRTLDTYTDDDGSLVIRGRLPAEMGAILSAALTRAEAELDRRLLAHAADGQRPPGSEAVDGETAVRRDSPGDPAGAGCSARRADALAWLAQVALRTSPDEGASQVTSGGVEVIVEVSAEALTGPDDGELHDGARHAEVQGGPPLAVATIRRLCCDAGLVPLVSDAGGAPLNVGRRTRAIPPSIRRAMVARDRCCRFPGCDRTRWLQAHHIEHWARGGETRLGNLVLLCHHHHQLVHEGGFTLTTDDREGGGYEVRTPHGHRLEQVPGHPVVSHDMSPVSASGARWTVAADAASASDAARDTGGRAEDTEPSSPGPMSLFPGSAGAPWDLGYAVDALLDWTSPTILAGCP